MPEKRRQSEAVAGREEEGSSRQGGGRQQQAGRREEPAGREEAAAGREVRGSSRQGGPRPIGFGPAHNTRHPAGNTKGRLGCVESWAMGHGAVACLGQPEDEGRVDAVDWFSIGTIEQTMGPVVAEWAM
jgi:hypothetical protein